MTPFPQALFSQPAQGDPEEVDRPASAVKDPAFYSALGRLLIGNVEKILEEHGR